MTYHQTDTDRRAKMRSSGWLIMGILLLLLPTLSQAAFEKPVIRSARSLLEPEMLKGEHFSVADEVPSEMASAELKKAGYQIHAEVRSELVPAEK